MSIKIKLKPNVLDKLTFAKYATLLRVKIQKVKKLGKSVPCLIFTDHSFPDPKLKGKLLPLILIFWPNLFFWCSFEFRGVYCQACREH